MGGLCLVMLAGLFNLQEGRASDRPLQPDERDTPSVEQFVQLLREQSAVLENASDFQLQAYLTAFVPTPRKPDFWTSESLVRKRGEWSQVLVCDDHKPVVLFGNDRIYSLTTEGEWEVEKSRLWNFRIDEKNRQSFSAPKGVTAGEPRIRINLAGYLGPLVFGNERQFTYDTVTRTWVGEYVEKRILAAIQTYSPTDELRTGFRISDILLTQKPLAPGEHHRQQHIRAIVRNGSDSGLALEPKDVPQTFEAVLVDEPQGRSSLISTVAEDTAALRMWREHIRSGEDFAIGQQLTQDVTSYFVSVSANGLPQSQNLLFEKLPRMTANLRALRRSAVARDMAAGRPALDDPGLKWHLLQRSVEPHALSWLYNLVPLALWQVGTPTLEEFALIMDFLDALGDGGEPPFAAAVYALAGNETPATHFYQTVLLSRWQSPCSEDQVKLCEQFLAHTGTQAEFRQACVETLLRLDASDRIPADDRQWWWDRAVASADEVDRWEAVSVASAQPTGRRWLLAQLGQTDRHAQPGLYSCLSQILRQRALATKELSRWESMSRQECDAILEATLDE
jgi:hypothetical protein